VPDFLHRHHAGIAADGFATERRARRSSQCILVASDRTAGRKKSAAETIAADMIFNFEILIPP